jgi:hypothetical protein
MITTSDIFLGISDHTWTGLSAIASIAYDALTLALVVFAAIQIWLARREARTNRTISACDRYDFDPILDQACRRIAAARDSGDLQKNPQKYRLDMYSTLNYLETLAIGVERGLYDAKMVKGFLEPIMATHVDEYLTSGLVARAAEAASVPTGSNSQYYEELRGLLAKWSRSPWYKRILRNGRKT